MTKPRAHLVQPVAIGTGIQTQTLLDRRVNEDARHFLILCRRFDQRFNLRLPLASNHLLAVAGNQIDRLRLQQLLRTPTLARQL
ncbi:hypothetical protein D3C71_2068220 [compost metagenome]